MIAPMRVDGTWLRDDDGRILIPRGVNLGGSSKLPAGSRDDRRRASFVGRPFPLARADGHFARLERWGMRLVRLLVTWEAVEHAGPGEYDSEYLDYLRELASNAARHGIDLIVDPHQDVWSRWTGGDGAPAWTLEGAGFNLRSLHASGAAVLPEELGSDSPRMIWPTNVNRLGCATMFTLFFAGNELAPGIRIFGEPAQELLQRRYTAAMCRVARSLRGLPNVVGFGAMNEPSLGFIGLSDIRMLQRAPLRLGAMPTPLEAMAAGSGLCTRSAIWSLGITGERRCGSRALNPSGVSAWAPGEECIWKRLGVWEDKAGTPRARRPDHFAVEASPADRYLKPFMLRFAAAVRETLPDAILFADSAPAEEAPRWGPGEGAPLVLAPHWYDGLTMATGRYHERFTVDPKSRRLSIGRRGVRRSFALQLGRERLAASESGLPCFIGETGVPFEPAGHRCARFGYRREERALADYYDALDANLLGAALWNYTADNDGRRGDGWNGEDFSIYTSGAVPAGAAGRVDDGARALRGFCRPYAERIAGTPLGMSFDGTSRVFELRYLPEGAAPTVLYVPPAQYPEGYRVELTGARSVRALRDEPRRQLLLYAVGGGEAGEVRLLIRPAEGA